MKNTSGKMAVVKFTSYFIMPVHGLHCHVLIVFELSAILCEYTRDEKFLQKLLNRILVLYLQMMASKHFTVLL